MKNTVYILAAVAALFTVAACGGMKKSEKGYEYSVVTKGEGKAVGSDTTALLYAHYSLANETNDSILVETFTKGSPVYIPVVEPNFREVFQQLSVGDSVVIKINADSFFMNSFGQPRPPYFKEGDNVLFRIKVVDIMNEGELRKKQEDERKNMLEQDSIGRAKMIGTLNNVQTTESGLTYEVMKKGSAKKVSKGQKVTVLYKGYLLNGQVFDENLTEGFKDLPVGLGQVIPGWDEMLQLMHVGEKVKVVIPWKLAYGPQGMQTIPPFSTLVFEMEVVSAK